MKTIKLLFCFSLFIFNSSLSFGQSWVWGVDNASIVPFAGNVSVTRDDSDNVIIAGNYAGTMVFGAQYLFANDCTEIFVAKFNKHGILKWLKGSGSPISSHSLNYCHDLCTDKSGNIYLAGSSVGRTGFDHDSIISDTGYSAILVKYDRNGNAQWIRVGRGVAGYCSFNSIVLDTTGNIYLTGGYTSTVTFGKDTLIAHNNVGFLVKYNSKGNFEWAIQPKLISLSSNMGFSSIALDSEKSEYIFGNISQGTFVIGSDTIAPQGNGTYVLAKYDSNGKGVWARTATTKKTNYYWSAYGIQVCSDKEGDAYVTGYLTDTVIVGHDTLTSVAGKNGALLVKYLSNGNVDWAKSSTNLDNNAWSSTSIRSDTLDFLYLTVTAQTGLGIYNKFCKIVFSKDTLTTSQFDTATEFFLKIDTAGNILNKSIIPANAPNIDAIAPYPDDSCVYLAGLIFDDFVFGKDTCSHVNINQPEANVFVAKWVGDSLSIITSNNTTNRNILHLDIFPNPNNGAFTLELSGFSGQSSIEVYNMLGEKVYSTPTPSPSGEGNVRDRVINLSTRPNGIYLYRVIDASGVELGNGKFIIER